MDTETSRLTSDLTPEVQDAIAHLEKLKYYPGEVPLWNTLNKSIEVAIAALQENATYKAGFAEALKVCDQLAATALWKNGVVIKKDPSIEAARKLLDSSEYTNTGE